MGTLVSDQFPTTFHILFNLFADTMNSENLPTSKDEQYDPNLEAQDEDVVSGGNNRLMYILGAVVLALIIGYIALPKGNGSGLASATPSFMLEDAAVTATGPTGADSIAAGLKAAPGAAPEETDGETKKTRSTTRTVAATATDAAGTAAPTTVDATASAPAAEPEPVAAAPEPAPVAAPANVTMSGKIEDENGRPMVGATVFLRGSSRGTSTDASGNYTMEVPTGTDNTLVYGYAGYDDEVVRTRGNQPVNVTLTPRAKTKKRR
jgi:hypothetical protein